MTPMQVMAQHAAQGRLALQLCEACGLVQYPPRELCVGCLSDALTWQVTDDSGGELLACTILHHSHDASFRTALPLRVGLVRLDPGPTAVCFLDAGSTPGCRVRIAARIDASGRAVLHATAEPPR